MQIVWVAGGSGLVGSELLKLLLREDCAPGIVKVLALGRRALATEHPKLMQARVDFLDQATMLDLERPDAALCALGTTIKKAGSKQAFRAVDFTSVLNFARAARQRGAKRFVHVSSLGASPNSLQFYLRVKGEIEAELQTLGFESVCAIRPSILDGDRSESRPAERIGLALARAMSPLLGKYRPTLAADVASCMLRVLHEAAPGAHVVEGNAIK
jgi:uncharacterized protein YbjT (DUF2867 family)